MVQLNADLFYTTFSIPALSSRDGSILKYHIDNKTWRNVDETLGPIRRRINDFLWEFLNEE